MWSNPGKVQTILFLMVLLASSASSERALIRQRRVISYPINSCTGVSFCGVYFVKAFVIDSFLRSSLQWVCLWVSNTTTYSIRSTLRPTTTCPPQHRILYRDHWKDLNWWTSETSTRMTRAVITFLRWYPAGSFIRKYIVLKNHYYFHY